MSLNKSHQTAVFFRTNPDASAKHRERAARAAESFNQPGTSPVGTIKADIYSVLPNGYVFPGLVWNTYEVQGLGFVGVSSPDMRAAAKEAGYALTVIIDTTETEVADYTNVTVDDDEYGYDDDEYDDEPLPNIGFNEKGDPADVSDDALNALLLDVLFPPIVEAPASTGLVINVETINFFTTVG